MMSFIQTTKTGIARSTAVSVLALALAACASQGGLKPQGTLLRADVLHAPTSLGADGLVPAAFPAADWWRQLGDAQLNALVDEALTGHPSLDAADARLRQAEAQAGTARADRLPSVNAGVGYTGLRLPESLAGEERGGHYAGSGRLSLDARFAVDLWGGRRAAWEAAVDAAHAATIDAQAARLMLSSQVVEAYVALDHAWRRHDVAGEEQVRSERALQLTRQRRNAGIDSDLQVRQAEARVPAARQQVQDSQQQIDAARNALAALLGQGPDRGLRIARPRPLDPLPLRLPAQLPSELLGRRPDIVAARWRVEAADQQVKVARTRFYPSLDLTALAGVVAPHFGDLLQSSSGVAYIGPAFSLPIFDGGRLRAGLAGSNAQRDLAVADYNQKVLDALRDVADQVSALRSLETQVTLQSDALQTARSAFELAEQRHRAGIGNYLDVLSAQQSLLQSQQQLADLQSRQLLSSVRLNQALGGGYQPGPASIAHSTN